MDEDDTDGWTRRTLMDGWTRTTMDDDENDNKTTIMDKGDNDG